MRICRPSILDASRPLIGLLILAGSLSTSQASEPTQPPTTRAAPPPSNRTGPVTPSEGGQAMDRLKAAVAGQKTSTQRGPAALPQPSRDLEKRAFQGLRDRRPAPEAEARARRAALAGKAALASEREQMEARLYQALGLEAPDGHGLTKAKSPPEGVKSWVPVLFASASMPLSTLRTYALQLERVGGVIAFRGVPGGLTRIGPMAKLTAQILRNDPGCEGPDCAMRNVQMVVDPLLFRQHGVARVPALAMVPGDPTQPYCDREDDAAPRASHLVYGDAALTGLLDEYARLGGREEVRDAQARFSRR